ncbi:MAG: hypothetical protein IPN95_23940 [Bacteroidetes bacterium]|nr:hypothetical protein [Bacteroidota bacterium]
MGSLEFGGNLIIDANLNGIADVGETTIVSDADFSKFTFSVPGTGSNLRMRLDLIKWGELKNLPLTKLKV